MLQLLVLICALFLPQSQLFLPPTSHRDSPRPGEVLPPKDGWQSLETFFDCHNCEGKGYWRPGAEGGWACCSASAAAAKSLQSCPTLCDPIDGSLPGSPRPWDSPGKNTGVGCHFLLQCMKVKSESEVTQSCPTLSDPPHGLQPTRLLRPWDLPGKSTGVGCHCLLWLCIWRCTKHPTEQRRSWPSSSATPKSRHY